MSTILRTGKFLRCFASTARAILNTPKCYDNNLLQGTRSLTSGYLQTWGHGMATQAAESLEPLLQRLDAEVRRCGRLSRRDLDEMLEEVRHRHSVTSSQSLLIIRCCGNLVPEELPEERTRLVEQIWKTLVERGVAMDISHYNALLRVYIENEHDFSPADFLKELEEKGIEPNRVTYQRLMWRHCQRGDVEGASRVLESMRAQQLPLSEAVLDALVLGHSRLGDDEGARSVLGVMASAGLQPGPRTYALLMGGSAARGDLQQIERTIQECKDKEIYLSDKDFMDVIEECALNGHEEHIDFLLKQMQRSAGYNQEAICLILRLVTRGREKAALKVLRTLTQSANPVAESTPIYQGAFFIRHLVKVNRSAETIISICCQLQDENLSPKALFIATDAALQMGNLDLAVPLLRTLKASGNPIRQHYFWPLFVASKKYMNDDSILNIVRLMMEEFKIGISNETLRDYVIRNLKQTDPSRVMNSLREAGVPIGLAGKTLVHTLLLKNNLQDAARFASKYGIKLNMNISGKALVSSLMSTGDIESFVTIVHLTSVENNQKKYQQTPNEDGEQEDDNSTQELKHSTGKLISDVVGQVQNLMNPPFQTLLEALHSRGLGISTKWAEQIQEGLGDRLTPEISELLAKLTSEDLESMPVDSPNYPSIRRSAESLENIIMDSSLKGENVTSLKRQLLMAYIRNKQVDKVEELLQKLESENFVLTPGMLALLVELYAQNENMEKAEKYLKEINSKDADFVLDNTKIIKLVQLYTQNDQFEKAAEFLKKQNVEQGKNFHNFQYNSLCWRFLNSLADQGNADKLNKVFKILMDKELIEVNNSLLGPLVKVHLVAGDVARALDEFERCCREHRLTPWKGELTRRLIAAEDAAGLQRLTDLSTLIHGEVNSLYDLVFGFVECGRLRQARRILETPGMRTRNQRFNSACERYGQEGKVDCLEGLLEATRELSHIDRSEVFQQLLITYTKENNVEKALGLWTLLQEESVPPTDKFLIHLAELLKSNNMNVPFVIPSLGDPAQTKAWIDAPVVKSKEIRQERKHKVTEKKQNFSGKFDTAIAAGDIDTALSLKNSPELGKNLRNSQVSDLIEKLVITGNLNKATDLTLEVVKRGSLPEISKVRFLLNSLAAKGDFDTFEELGKHFTEEQKKAISFDNRKCNAYISAGSGKVMEFLDKLDGQILSAQSESELKLLDVSFPKGGILGLLSESTIPRYIQVAENYAKKGLLTPFNILWMYYLINGQDDKAQKLWNDHLVKSDRIFFRRVLDEAREKSDDEILNKLLGYLKTTETISPKALGIVYSSLTNIYVTKGQNDKALATIQRALSAGVTLEDFNRTSLIRTKNAVENSGGQFDFQIPEKSTPEKKENALA